MLNYDSNFMQGTITTTKKNMHKYKNTLKFWQQLCLDTLLSLGDFLYLLLHIVKLSLMSMYYFLKQKILKVHFLITLNWIENQVYQDVTNGLAENNQEATNHNEGHNEDRTVCF